VLQSEAQNQTDHQPKKKQSTRHRRRNISAQRVEYIRRPLQNRSALPYQQHVTNHPAQGVANQVLPRSITIGDIRLKHFDQQRECETRDRRAQQRPSSLPTLSAGLRRQSEAERHEKQNVEKIRWRVRGLAEKPLEERRNATDGGLHREGLKRIEGKKTIPSYR
jgi:hypothetical protein